MFAWVAGLAREGLGVFSGRFPEKNLEGSIGEGKTDLVWENLFNPRPVDHLLFGDRPAVDHREAFGPPPLPGDSRDVQGRNRGGRSGGNLRGAGFHLLLGDVA